MVRSSCGLQQMGYVVLLVFFLLGLVDFVTTKSFMDVCGVDENWVCDKNIEKVPPPIVEVCEACGNYWGNIPGFGYCCRCSPKIFDFCLVAVFGYKR